MKEIVADLFRSPCDAVVITTNGFVSSKGRAVMGRGCAKQACDMFDGIDYHLGGLIVENGNVCQVLGEVTSDDRNYTIVSAPVKPAQIKVDNRKSNLVTQYHEKYDVGQVCPGFMSVANIDLIQQTAQQLVALANEHGWKTVNCPRFGCGAGELDWGEVREVVMPILDDRFVVCTFKADKYTKDNDPDMDTTAPDITANTSDNPLNLEGTVGQIVMANHLNFVTPDHFADDDIGQHMPNAFRLIVCGGRDFCDRQDALVDAFTQLSEHHTLDPENLVILSGMSRGADIEALHFAHANDIPCYEMPADWYNLSVEKCQVGKNRYGTAYNKLAGFNRNDDMRDMAHAVLAFWDGKSPGTKHMIQAMHNAGKPVFIYHY